MKIATSIIRFCIILYRYHHNIIASVCNVQGVKTKIPITSSHLLPHGRGEHGDVLHVCNGREGGVPLQPERRRLPPAFGHRGVGQADQRQRHTLKLLDAPPEKTEVSQLNRNPDT